MVGCEWYNGLPQFQNGKAKGRQGARMVHVGVDFWTDCRKRDCEVIVKTRPSGGFSVTLSLGKTEERKDDEKERPL